MSAYLPGDAGCKTYERIVVLLVFIAQKNTAKITKDSLQVAGVGVLPHVTAQRRHFGK